MKTNAAVQTAEFTPPSAAQIQGAIDELKTLLGQRATTADAIREHHSHGESYHPAALPDVVCFPQSTEEVSAIVKISAKYGVPMIPFGGGTSMEAQVNAIYGGITLDMRQMNKIVNISVEDLQATVEAGVTRLQLNRALENSGFTFFIDPGADATLAGMASTRASGTTAVRYGTMRENVLALKVVLADGRVIKTGSRAEVRGGLRSDEAVRRRRGHAWRDDRSDGAAASAAGSRGCSELHLRDDPRCDRDRHGDDPARHRRGADRVHG